MVLIGTAGGRAGSAEAGECVEKLGAEGGQHRKEAKCALLQPALRIEGIEKQAFVAVENAGAKIFGAAGLPFQLEKLVKDFAL